MSKNKTDKMWVIEIENVDSPEKQLRFAIAGIYSSKAKAIDSIDTWLRDYVTTDYKKLKPFDDKTDIVFARNKKGIEKMIIIKKRCIDNGSYLTDIINQ